MDIIAKYNVCDNFEDYAVHTNIIDIIDEHHGCATGTVDGCRKMGFAIKPEEEPIPYLNRAARRKKKNKS